MIEIRSLMSQQKEELYFFMVVAAKDYGFSPLWNLMTKSTTRILRRFLTVRTKMWHSWLIGTMFLFGRFSKLVVQWHFWHYQPNIVNYLSIWAAFLPQTTGTTEFNLYSNICNLGLIKEISQGVMCLLIEMFYGNYILEEH